MYLKCLYYSGKKNLLLKNSTFLNQKIFQTFQHNTAMFLRYNNALFYNTEIIRFVTGKRHLSQQFYHISCLFASEKKKK